MGGGGDSPSNYAWPTPMMMMDMGSLAAWEATWETTQEVEGGGRGRGQPRGQLKGRGDHGEGWEGAGQQQKGKWLGKKRSREGWRHTERSTEKRGRRWGREHRTKGTQRNRDTREEAGWRRREAEGGGSQVCFCETPRPLLCLWTSITWDSFYVGPGGGTAVAGAPVQGDHPMQGSMFPGLLPGQAGLGTGAGAPEVG